MLERTPWLGQSLQKKVGNLDFTVFNKINGVPRDIRDLSKTHKICTHVHPNLGEILRTAQMPGYESFHMGLKAS